MRSDPDSASIAGGNAFTSEVLEIQKNGNTSWPIEIVIDQETTPRALRQIPNSKLLEFRSDLLSQSHSSGTRAHEGRRVLSTGPDSMMIRTGDGQSCTS